MFPSAQAEAGAGRENPFPVSLRGVGGQRKGKYETISDSSTQEKSDSSRKPPVTALACSALSFLLFPQGSHSLALSYDSPGCGLMGADRWVQILTLPSVRSQTLSLLVK